MLAVVGLSASAHAYESLHTAEGAPVRWGEMPIRYAINAAPPQHQERAAADALIHAAFDAWGEASANAVRFDYDGLLEAPSTDFHPDHPEAAHNVVHFTTAANALPDGQLAFTVVRFSEATGEVLNAHIFVDEANHDFGPDGPAYDIQSTLTHEVGHFLGLDHSTEESSVMHSGLQRGASRTVAYDDELAALTLYESQAAPLQAAPGPDATRSIGCATTGGAPAASEATWPWTPMAALVALALLRRRRR